MKLIQELLTENIGATARAWHAHNANAVWINGDITAHKGGKVVINDVEGGALPKISVESMQEKFGEGWEIRELIIQKIFTISDSLTGISIYLKITGELYF